MASIFQNDSGTWNYGTSVYGSLSEAQEAERRDNQKIARMFLGGGASTSSSDSFVGFVVKVLLFFFVCSFIVKYYYIVIPVAILILLLIIRNMINKSHARKAAENFKKINELYQTKDYDSIFLILKQNADKYKDAESMYYISLSYKNGEGTEPNEEQYMSYLGKAAKNGYPMAQYLYGSLLAMGEENAPEKQQKTGFKFLKKSIKDKNNTEIQSFLCNYALALYYGRGTKKNEKKAKTILTKLADSGNKNAKDLLVNMN